MIALLFTLLAFVFLSVWGWKNDRVRAYAIYASFRTALALRDFGVSVKRAFFGNVVHRNSSILQYASDEVVFVHELDVVHNNDTVKVNAVSTDDTIQPHDIAAKILENFRLRNNIVHCNISTTEFSDVLDVTEMFRHFVYHFQERHHDAKLKHFFQWVKQKHNLTSDFSNLNFVVYRNDSDFSEVVYRVPDIYDKHYIDILE